MLLSEGRSGKMGNPGDRITELESARILSPFYILPCIERHGGFAFFS
jgi:hypothetical protein